GGRIRLSYPQWDHKITLLVKAFKAEYPVAEALKAEYPVSKLSKQSGEQVLG
ncbi:hypothetical protein A2U01_0097912, partial [Trifolium medium]|nr:hypothetical protein [Trifolium medium]